jgi:solute carrier family 38 (sodium-coupled neutral amino acid transporter), member 11
MKNFGIVIGVFVFILVSAMTNFSCVLLLRAKNNTGHTKYASIGIHCFKKPGEVIIKLIIILNNFGLCVSYLLIFGKSMSLFLKDVSEADTFWTSKPLMIVIMCILIFPLIAAKEFTKLKVSSWVCVGAVLVFCVVTTYNFANKVNSNTLPSDYNIFPTAESFDYKSALACFPTVFLAFTFQFNFFPVYKSVSNVSDRKMLKISFAAIGSCLGIYLFTALLGYMSYGSQIKKTFLDNLNPEDLGTSLYYVVLIAYSVNAALGFPIQYFSLRNNMISIIKDIKKVVWRRGGKKRQVENYQNTVTRKNIFFYTITLILYVILIIIAIIVNDLGMVFAIIGAICANAISYILPAMFYIKVRRKKRGVYTLALVLAVFGLIAGVLSIIGEFLKFSD